MQSTAKKLSLYLSIDYDFLDDPKVLALTGWAFKTLMYLLRYKDGKRLNGWTIPVAQETLASKVNCTGKSLRKYIKELETAGFITSKNTQKRVYKIETQAREILPRPSVKNTDRSNISINNITNPPNTVSITNSNLGAKEGEGKEEFKRIKEALRNKDNSNIPNDEQIQKVIDQIHTDDPIAALVYAIQKVDVPRIAHLPKLFDAARKNEGQFWKLILDSPIQAANPENEVKLWAKTTLLPLQGSKGEPMPDFEILARKGGKFKGLSGDEVLTIVREVLGTDNAPS